MGYLAKVKDIQLIEYSLDNIGMARVSEVVHLDQQNPARHQRNPQMTRPNPGMWSLIKLQD